MSVSCLQARALFVGDNDEQGLAPADRRMLRAHLADCRVCREEAAHEDVGLLFAGIGGAEVSPQDVERILSGVRAGIALRQTERRLESGRGDRSGSKVAGVGRRRFLFTAAAAALAVLTLLLPGAPARRAKPSSTAGRGESRSFSAGPLVPAARPAAVPVQPAPGSKLPGDATIYDWNPGSGQPRVVWIVDRSLDI